MMVKVASSVASAALRVPARPAAFAAPLRSLHSLRACVARPVAGVAPARAANVAVAARQGKFLGMAAARIKSLRASISTSAFSEAEQVTETAETAAEAAPAAEATEEKAEAAAAPPQSAQLFIGNLSWGTDDAALMKMFEELKPTKANVVMDTYTGRSRGYGYVSFPDIETANSAIAQFNGTNLDGREIRCELKGQPAPGYERSERPRQRSQRINDDDRRLYIGNLAWELQDADLVDLCSHYGNVERARVILNQETGMSRGFGFVTMSSVDESQLCIKELHDLSINGRYLKVNLAAEGSKPAGPRITLGARKGEDEAA